MKNVVKVIMALVCSMALVVSVAVSGEARHVKAADNKAKALKAYQKFLSKDEIFGYPSKHWSFKVIDVNHDGMPELLLDNVGENYLTRLCAYKGKKVIEVDSISNRHGLYHFYNKGSVWCAVDGIGMGTLTTNYCKIKKGKVKVVASSIVNEWEQTPPTYIIGKKEVSKKKYNAYIKKLIKKNYKEDNEPMYEVTTSNIKRYCK